MIPLIYWELILLFRFPSEFKPLKLFFTKVNMLAIKRLKFNIDDLKKKFNIEVNRESLSLPPFPIAKSLEEVKNWYAKKGMHASKSFLITYRHITHVYL